ncbi:hypothetical protein Ahy_B01g054257 [Arachis hypogaea]|uniref:GRF-type domain-containing protein n=1 Tax=Arachis hypogaea TaxID=3818 RepID=A0A445ATL2_ARAHY|nr:hypothetical protein Ahy_B01g054257 [Arachis hypogaea]
MLFSSTLHRTREWCACGSRPLLRWSTTDSNPGRPFMGCPNYNIAGKRWCGLFLWVDKILEEDAVTCDGRTSSSNDNEEWKMKIAWKLGRLESEVRVLKMGGGILVFTCMLLLLVKVVVLVLRIGNKLHEVGWQQVGWLLLESYLLEFPFLVWMTSFWEGVSVASQEAARPISEDM